MNKLPSIFFMALPFVFCALTWFLRESDGAVLFFGLWMLASIICLGWGFYIRRSLPSLAWGCVGVGMVQFALVLDFAVADTSQDTLDMIDPWPNQSRQPTPGERLGYSRTLVARRGCAHRSA